jgi:hypothetical protein
MCFSKKGRHHGGAFTNPTRYLVVGYKGATFAMVEGQKNLPRMHLIIYGWLNRQDKEIAPG